MNADIITLLHNLKDEWSINQWQFIFDQISVMHRQISTATKVAMKYTYIAGRICLAFLVIFAGLADWPMFKKHQQISTTLSINVIHLLCLFYLARFCEMHEWSEGIFTLSVGCKVGKLNKSPISVSNFYTLSSSHSVFHTHTLTTIPIPIHVASNSKQEIEAKIRWSLFFAVDNFIWKFFLVRE